MSGFFPTGSGGGGGGLGSPLVSAVLGAPAASISVAGIPTSSGGVSLRNLLVIWGKLIGTGAVNSVNCNLVFNNDGTVGHYGQAAGPGGFAGGFGNPGFNILIPGANNAGAPGGGYMYLFDYVDNANFPGCFWAEYGRIALAGTAADFVSPPYSNGQYQVVGPINRIDILPVSGNLNTGGYLEVFGIA